MAAHALIASLGKTSKTSSVEARALFILNSESAVIQVLKVRASEAQARNEQSHPALSGVFLMSVSYAPESLTGI